MKIKKTFKNIVVIFMLLIGVTGIAFHLAVLRSDAAKQIVTEIPTIENWYIGGNHAYSGNYGEQKGDGKAVITKEEQWQETVDDILDFLHKTGGLTDEDNKL